MKDFKYASLKLFIFVYERIKLILRLLITWRVIFTFLIFFKILNFANGVSFVSLWVGDLLMEKIIYVNE